MGHSVYKIIQDTSVIFNVVGFDDFVMALKLPLIKDILGHYSNFQKSTYISR